MAGCNGVLLKPFPPILLVTRISRLLKDHAAELKRRAAVSLGRAAYARGKAAHLVERIDLLRNGTNRVWPATHCPYCSNQGVTSFEHASMRRAWYACVACRKVWIAKRHD
jgi:hypothetical protein